MRPTFFISDLHLCAERPHITRLFERFIAETATAAESLYILGDLFESWIGDDQLDIDTLAQNVAHQLSALAAGGTHIFLMHGKTFSPGNKSEVNTIKLTGASFVEAETAADDAGECGHALTTVAYINISDDEGTRDATESEYRGNQSDDEKNDGVVQHVVPFE